MDKNIATPVSTPSQVTALAMIVASAARESRIAETFIQFFIYKFLTIYAP